MQNFWQKLPKLFTVLAPMDDVTDTVFRQVILRVARPDVFFTEFINVEGLCSKGREALLPRLRFSKGEHPIVAQIWGIKPENFREAAKLIKDSGFDGVDINMGCPDKKVTKNGAGAALIDNPGLAKEIIIAAKEGAGGLPVSVKTRIGFKVEKTEEWLEFLLKQDLAALTIHARTAKEMSKVPARWEEIGKAVKLRDELKAKTVIIGNGDVASFREVLEKHWQFGVDGVMIGRGIFQNPWVFQPHEMSTCEASEAERLKLLLFHAKLWQKTWADKKSFIILRKFFKVYASGFLGASALRTQLLQVNSLAEVKKIFSCRTLT